MKRMISAVTIAASAAAVALSQATVATAAPTPIHYQAKAVGHTVIMSTDAGDLVVTGGQLQIRNAAKTVVSSIPLQYSMNGKMFPIGAQAAGRTVTLTPRTDAAAARVAPGYVKADANGYATKQQRDDAALGRLGMQVGVPIAIGSLVGTAIGAGVGCLLGPGGCLAGLVLGASVGSIVGSVGVGLPALGIALANYTNTVNAPF
jgi:hypothetical protein